LRVYCAVLSFLAAVGVEAQERPGITVLDLEVLAPSGDLRREGAAATLALTQGLRELEAFDVIASADVRQLVSVERQRQLLGAPSGGADAGARELVRSLGVRHMVVGTLTKAGDQLQVEVRLLDTRDGKVVQQRSATAPDLEKLNESLKSLAQQVVAPLLAEEVGTLLVRTREEGAEVFVDDVSRGSTPMSAPVSLPRGKHKVVVKKDGFIARVSTANVKRGELAVEEAELVPSSDYADAYKVHHKRLRMGAYIATGVAAAAFGSALLLDRAVAEGTYQNEFLPRQKALAIVQSGGGADDVAPGTKEAECLGDVAACRTQTQQLSSQLSTLSVASWALVGLGVASAGVATYCWVAGDEPNRYVQMVAGVAPGGGSVGIVGRF
jgi:TolB-like protein